MEKRWVVKKSGDTEQVNSLASALGVEKSIANLLVQRGVTDADLAKAFFHPELNMLHDPFLMKDMDIAISRIETAIANSEKILVYGDYDVDGTTAVALVLSFFKKTYPALDYYIPDRYSEGYGISIKSIDFASENNFKLIIALDCGIKAIEQVAYAKSKGIDFIICDHHRPSAELPAAIAILDPKQNDCTYPFNELSGCGVGFKLIQAYSQKHNIPFENIMQYLDLVAISIASDIVEITGENRILAYYGLKQINTAPRPGIEAILFHCGMKRKTVFNTDDFIFNKELNINDLVFMIGPRLNASGRIEHGKSTVELLLCEDSECAAVMSDSINLNNTERRTFDTSITQQALEMIWADKKMMKAKTTVVFNPEWHKGVVGIVASRLTDSFYRPTIVLTQSNGLISGSARSVKDFDIYDAIDACRDLLEHFGGHKYAAGLSMKAENLELFKQRFEEVVSSTINEDSLVPEIAIDTVLNLSDITPKFFTVLKQFAPFGPGNMSPIFLTKGVVDKGFARLVGENHLKLCVTHPASTNNYFAGIAFQQAKHLPFVNRRKPFDICYHVEENEWNGSVYLQLNVKDIKIT